MALVQVGDSTILRGSLSFPFSGAWALVATLEHGDAPTGPVTISGPELTLSGIAVRGGSLYDRTSVRVIGARVGLVVPARIWHGVPLRLPFADVAAAIGSSVASSSDAGMLATLLDVWTRSSGPAATELDALAAAASGTWRILDDGSTWLGTDAWAESDLAHRILDVAEAERVRTIGLEDFSLRPGVVLDGMQVARVTYRIDQERVRCDVHGQP